jgi:hypothetical protein
MELCLPQGIPSDLIVTMTVPWRDGAISRDARDKDVFTYIRHPGKTFNSTIVDGTIEIPPEDAIANLGFFKTIRKEGGKQANNSPVKEHGHPQKQMLWVQEEAQ